MHVHEHTIAKCPETQDNSLEFSLDLLLFCFLPEIVPMKTVDCKICGNVENGQINENKSNCISLI